MGLSLRRRQPVDAQRIRRADGTGPQLGCGKDSWHVEVCHCLPETPVDKALLAAGRLANPHGQAVFFGKIHVFYNAMQAVAHAQFKLPRNLGTHTSFALANQ